MQYIIIRIGQCYGCPDHYLAAAFLPFIIGQDMATLDNTRRTHYQTVTTSDRLLIRLIGSIFPAKGELLNSCSIAIPLRRTAFPFPRSARLCPQKCGLDVSSSLIGTDVFEKCRNHLKRVVNFHRNAVVKASPTPEVTPASVRPFGGFRNHTRR